MTEHVPTGDTGTRLGDTAAVPLSSARGRWILAATVLASALAQIEATVVNVALPAIGQDLDAGMSGLQWVLNGYLLTLAALILLGGSLGDRLGRRRILVAGVVLFSAASAVCAAAPTIGTLIAARVLQGIGGPCSRPAAWRCSRRCCGRRTGPGRSGRGPRSAVSPPRSGRWSAAGSWSCRGAGCSCCRCRWASGSWWWRWRRCPRRAIPPPPDASTSPERSWPPPPWAG
jgi:MFS family permease